VRVFIDPGHGGEDPGAVGPGGVREADINLAVALELAPVLERAGCEVKLSRTGDYRLVPMSQANSRTDDLKARSDMANEWGAHVCISIHHNGSGTSDPEHKSRGIETYVFPGSPAQVLGALIHGHMVVFMGAKDRGLRFRRFWMLRKTKMMAVLTEGAYVTNEGECALLQCKSYQTREALAIAAGIMAWARGREVC